MKLINIGFGNMVSASRLVAIVSPESAPIRRIIAGLPSHCRRRGTARNTNCKSIFLPTAS